MGCHTIRDSWVGWHRSQPDGPGRCGLLLQIAAVRYIVNKNGKFTGGASDPKTGVRGSLARAAERRSCHSHMLRRSRNGRLLVIRIGTLALLLSVGPYTICLKAAGRLKGQAYSGDEALYATIDAHALAAPPETRNSISALAAWLSAPARNEREKARAIFRWVTANVSYVDDEEDQALDSRPEAVLQRGTAVCAGYSDLFVSLARSAGLEAVAVSGWAKGYGTQPGSRFGGPKNHAWNAVRVDGEWCLVDCTWGAGSVDGEGVYRKRFEPFYFLTPPGNLRYSHFPREARWQLLKPALSLEEFEVLPFLRPAFFHCDLSALKPPAATIQACRPLVSIEFDAPRDVLLLVRLFRQGEPIEPAGLRIRSKRERRSIDMLLPGDGEFLLRIYASRNREVSGKTRRYRGVLDYRIESSGGVPVGSIGGYLRNKERGDQGGASCGHAAE
jgi:hypothetical protein